MGQVAPQPVRIVRSAQGRVLRIFLFALAALCGLSSAGSAASQGDKRFLTEYRMDREVVTIPFEYVRSQILVKGEADDHKGLTFLVDTGATVPVLDRRLGYSGHRMGDVVFHEAEGVTPAEKVYAESLRLSDGNQTVEVRNSAALIVDLSQVGRSLNRKIDGILGMGFLAGFVTEFDYEKRVIRLYDTRRFTIAQRMPDNRRTFLFDLQPLDPRNLAGCQVLKGRLHPQFDFKFLLDTGFSGYVSVPRDDAEASGMYGRETPSVRVISYSLTRQFISHKIRAPFLTLGEVNLSGRVVQIDERDSKRDDTFGIVGNRFFENYRLTLDPLRRKLWLERVTTKDAPDIVELPSLGMDLRRDGVSLRVAQVRRNSPAFRAGVRPGDLVVSVNGVISEAQAVDEAERLITSSEGEVALTLARGADPNLGPRREAYSCRLIPSSPLEWKGN